MNSCCLSLLVSVILLQAAGCRSQRLPKADSREGASVIVVHLLRPAPAPLPLVATVLAAQGFTLAEVSPKIAAHMLLTNPQALPSASQITFQVRVSASAESIFLSAKFTEQIATSEQKGYARWYEAAERPPKAVFQILERIASDIPHRKLEYLRIPFEQHERQARELERSP